MKLRSLLLLSILVIGIGEVKAQDTPSELRTLVGARASSGEATLQRLGYKFIKTTEGDDRKWSNWWKSSSRTCVTVATVEGRYDSIVTAPAADCEKGNDSGSATGSGSDAFEDLVGARASSGESELKSRGFKFVKTVKQDDRSFSNWWKASSKTCLTVATFDGRYDSIVSGPAEDCKKESTDSGNATSNGAPDDVADLVGARAAGGETDLKSRGYGFIKTSKSGDRSYSNWWKAASKTCLTVTRFNGRFDTIVSGPAEDCMVSSGGSASSGSAAQIDLSDLVGARGAGADTEMQSRGFRNTRSSKSGSASLTYWFNPDNRQCAMITVRNGKVSSVTKSFDRSCK